jgi:hypothetical protein
MGQISVESRLPGDRDGALAMPKVVLSLEATSLSVRDLISHAVSAQIDQLIAIEQQQNEQETKVSPTENRGSEPVLSARKLLNRHYLSDREVQALAATGKVAVNDQPSRKPVKRRLATSSEESSEEQQTIVSVDQIVPATEIEKAFNAFNEGVFVMFVDGRQCTSLDEQIPLTSAIKAQFLRLMPLAGG